MRMKEKVAFLTATSSVDVVNNIHTLNNLSENRMLRRSGLVPEI